ncbi:MAG: RNA 2',3'-cyclic phosphodiesterase [Lachnospiraceae bacterium]|nr:RNA 2',3'-cyclic phosphodiesterase [Lachnospiraceae bacterium]
MSRLFVAVTLSDEIRKSVNQTLHEMKQCGIKGNYSPTANLHLTLAFIGEIREPEQVMDALRTVTWKPFKLSLDGLGCFGDILWVGVKGNQGLNGAARAVREALSAAQIRFDTKKFEPHITLIRKTSGNWKQVPAPKGEMMVKKISLMKSEQKNGRPVYTEIMAF